jgi:hypothetical protein
MESCVSEHSKPQEDPVRERAYQLWQEAGSPEGQADHFWHLAEQDAGSDEELYDKTLADSFPASDPPANSGITS